MQTTTKILNKNFVGDKSNSIIYRKTGSLHSQKRQEDYTKLMLTSLGNQAIQGLFHSEAFPLREGGR